MSSGFKNFEKGIGLVPNSTDQNTTKGDQNVLSSDGKNYHHNGTTSSANVTEKHASQGAARLTNKDLEDSTTAIVDASDTTKKVKIDAAGTTGTTTTITSSQTTDRTITLPDATDTLVGKATTDTLTNKTLSGNTATSLINGSGTLNTNSTGTITVPNATDTLVGKATTDTLTNKSIDGGTNTITNIGSGSLPATTMYTDTTQTVTGAKTFGSAGAVGKLKIAGTTSGSTILDATAVASGTLTLPAATDTLVGKATTDTLTNKTLTGNTAANLINGSGTLNINSTGTITVPNATDTLVGKATTDTLTNKTLSGNTATNLVSGSGTLTLNTTGTITVPNATDTLVAKTTTDTLTNKTLGDSLTFTQISTPSSPSSGFNKIYPKSDGKFYTLNSSGTEVAVGSGSGIINYITYGDAESGTTGWATYNEGKNASFTNGSSTIGITSNTGYAVGQRISLSTSGTLPTGFSPNTTYYVVSLVSTTGVTVSATLGGTAITAGSAGSGTQALYPMDPIAGTGGSVGGLTFATSSSSPLRGVNSYTLVQSSSTSVQGQGVSYDFTVDSADKAKVLSVIIDYNASSTFVASSSQTGSDSDIEFYIYDKTNSVLIPISPKVITAGGSNNYTFKGIFQTSSNSTSYRLIAHCVTSNANATGWTFKFDNVQVGPQTIVQGSPITDWTAYTPTFTGFGTPTSVSGFYRRNGGDVEIYGKYTSSSNTGVEARISLPPGLTSADTTLIPTIISAGQFLQAASLAGAVYTLIEPSVTYITLGTSATGSAALTKALANSFGASTYAFYAKVPISGWSSTVQMSQDTDSRALYLQYTGNAGTVLTANVTNIDWTTKVTDTHAAWNGTTFTAPVSGNYDFTGAVNFSTSSNFEVDAYVNAVKKLFVNTVASASVHTINGSIFLNSGDILSFRNANGATLSNGSQNHWLSIKRAPASSSIAATESVNARYNGATGTLTNSDSLVSYTNKDYDSHNAYSAGTYTIPATGKYQVNARVTGLNAGETSTQVISIYKNGVKYAEQTSARQLVGNNNNVSINDDVSCVPGDLITIKFRNDGSSLSFPSSTTQNTFSIKRVGN